MQMRIWGGGGVVGARVRVRRSERMLIVGCVDAVASAATAAQGWTRCWLVWSHARASDDEATQGVWCGGRPSQEVNNKSSCSEVGQVLRDCQLHLSNVEL